MCPSVRPSIPIQCDVFSLGITLYEIISGRPLPPNGEEWHSLRSGKAGMPMGLPAELSKTLHEMMHVSDLFFVLVRLPSDDYRYLVDNRAISSSLALLLFSWLLLLRQVDDVVPMDGALPLLAMLIISF